MSKSKLVIVNQLKGGEVVRKNQSMPADYVERINALKGSKTFEIVTKKESTTKTVKTKSKK